MPTFNNTSINLKMMKKYRNICYILFKLLYGFQSLQDPFRRTGNVYYLRSKFVILKLENLFKEIKSRITFFAIFLFVRFIIYVFIFFVKCTLRSETK